MKGCAHLNDSWLEGGRIKARIPAAPFMCTCAQADIHSKSRMRQLTISIKKDRDIPLGNKWGDVLNKGVGRGDAESQEITDLTPLFGKDEKNLIRFLYQDLM